MADEVVTTTGVPDPVDPLVLPPVDPPAPVDPPPAQEPPVDPPVDPADPDAPPPVVAKTRPNLQERISRITAERDEARRALADAVKAKETAPPNPVDPPPPPLAPVEAARPLREQFDAPEDFEAALVEWSSERAVRRALNAREENETQRRTRETEERTRTETEAATREQIKKITETWAERRTKFIESHPDFADIAEASPEDGGPVINHAMGHVILTDERGPEIAYYLGQNPDEARRIANLPDVGRINYELGKIAAKLDAPAAPSVSKAPAPITPIRSNGGTGEKDPNDETMEEYAARRNSELAARNRPGQAMH